MNELENYKVKVSHEFDELRKAIAELRRLLDLES